MIHIYRTAELTAATKNKLEESIHNEFGHIPIVQSIAWAVPGWSIIRYAEGAVAAFYNIVERDVLLDKKPYKVAGINNVITVPGFRGKGYASEILAATKEFLFTELRSDAGLLLCADALLPFYEKLGWYKVNSRVYFDQPASPDRRLWEANTMLLHPGRIEPQEIDLNGLPW